MVQFASCRSAGVPQALVTRIDSFTDATFKELQAVIAMANETN